ncbi:hypothetical protein PAMA_008213 [Pampus argenteus]
MMRSCGLVKPVSATRVTGRYLIQQKGLPILPVPTLRQTCERYLTAVEPFVEVDELKHIKQQLEEFQKPGGVGERLQRGLERRAHVTGNWCSEDLHDFFSTMRTPLVVHRNIASLFPKMDFEKDKQGQIRCAAKLIAGVLDIKTMIDNDTLPVENMRGKPMCMDQYNMILSSCCVPGPEKDSMVYHGNSSSPPTHITVVHNSELHFGVPNHVPTMNFNVLCPYDTNKESLSAIERSIFVVCLDGPMPKVSDEMYTNNAACQILHGGGSQWNSGNRWFDKPMQFIIGEDGECGGNFLHALADGTVLGVLSANVLAYMKKPEMMQSSTGSLSMPKKLHFNVTPEIKRDIEEAKQSMDLLAQDLDLKVLVFDHFGKNFLKAHRISPDAFVQMAIQLAYYRVHHYFGAVHEMASLRMFRYGRLAFLSAHSSAAIAFVKAFDDPGKQLLELNNFGIPVDAGFTKTAGTPPPALLNRKPEMWQSFMGPLPMPRKLHFITPELKRDIEEAKQSMDMMYQRCPAAVEPVSLRMFKHGRTGTVCATSSASTAFVKAFDDPGKQIKVGMMRSCGLVKPVSATRVTGRYLIQQKGLPILPVPTLQQTCDRYLTAVEPYVEVDELKHIKEQLEELQKPGGVGERLQRGLERRAHVTGNWVSSTTPVTAVDTLGQIY